MLHFLFLLRRSDALLTAVRARGRNGAGNGLDDRVGVLHVAGRGEEIGALRECSVLRVGRL